MKRRTRATAALTALVALATASVASAHVTLQPDSAAAGDFTVLSVRVPNESDTESTTKVAVQLPPGFAYVSYEPVPGWTTQVRTEKLAEPVESEFGPITEEIREVTWTGKGQAGQIKPGQFVDFPISTQIPGEDGDTLTFKALQTYSDGEVVRWIGAPDSEKPAPQVAVTAASEDAHGAAGHSEQEPAAAEEVAAEMEVAASSAESDDSDGNGLAIAALVVGALGLGVGGTALASTRRKTA